MSMKQIVVRGFLLGVLAAGLGAGAFLSYVSWYTRSERILPGVEVAGIPVGGLTSAEAQDRLSQAGVEVSRSSLPWNTSGSITLQWEDRQWPLNPAEVGVAPDLKGAVYRARAIGRQGSVFRRARAFAAGMVRGHFLEIQTSVDDQRISSRLEEVARELHEPARNAVYDFEAETAAAERAGRDLDLELSVEAVRAALLEGRPSANLVVRDVHPAVGTQELQRARKYRISRFTTPILAAEPGRVHNIKIAVKKISGIVVKPGDTFSFNETVGPRDAAHGWAQAKELYQGEFVLGYGGGICQVSSTLYNSILMAGLEVKQRFHHDRPLQYVSPGRDATVAWNLLDFKFRNSTGMPVLISAQVLPGRPQEIEVGLYAPHPQEEGRIRLEEADVRYFPPPMEEIMDATLPAGHRKVVDEGYYGIELKTYRVFREGGKERRELVSHDLYRPKTGKVRVGAGNAPGSRKLLNPGLQ